MINLVDFCNTRFGASGSIIAAIVFLALSVLGIIIAFRGRDAMVWLVGVCAAAVGVLAGAMAGLLIFNSLIVMLLTAFLGGVILILLVRFSKGIGYFIGISALSFFLAHIVTSEMYTANTKITGETLIAADLVIAVVMGILSSIRSKYLVSLITAASGGMITSICILAAFGVYFADWKTWLLALLTAAGGMLVQIRVYDIKRPSLKKKKNKENCSGQSS